MKKTIFITAIILAILSVAGYFVYQALTDSAGYPTSVAFDDSKLPWIYTIDEDDLLKGLDLSHHNKIVNYERQKDIDFIYHKATEGSTFTDPQFKSRMKRFSEIGIPCGAYHFFTTGSSGKAQFNHFKSVVSKDYPLIPVLDIEINRNNWSVSKLNGELAEWIRLCEKHYGVKPIIYSSSWFYVRYGLSQHGCMFWSGDVDTKPRVKCVIHQQTIKPVAGMAGKVDYDVALCLPYAKPESSR
jgi:lysozyme